MTDAVLFVWEWPQIVWAINVCITLVIYSVLDGSERTGKHSFAIQLVAIIASGIVLYFGGFFTVARP